MSEPCDKCEWSPESDREYEQKIAALESSLAACHEALTKYNDGLEQALAREMRKENELAAARKVIEAGEELQDDPVCTNYEQHEQRRCPSHWTEPFRCSSCRKKTAYDLARREMEGMK